MWAVTQRVEEKNVQIAQPVERRVGNRAEVGEISRTAETKAKDLSVAVEDRHGLKSRAEQRQRSRNVVHLYLREAAVFVIGIEDVLEDRTDDFARPLIRIKGDAAVRTMKAERSHVIEAEDVVRVAMRVNDRVDVTNTLAD